MKVDFIFSKVKNFKYAYKHKNLSSIGNCQKYVPLFIFTLITFNLTFNKE